MVDQCAIALGLSGIERLLQGIQNEVRVHGTADPPAHDASGVHVDHKGYVQPALPGRDVREVRDPELVGPLCQEPPVDPVQWAWRLHVADGGAHHLATAYALQAQPFHQALDRATGNGNSLAIHLLPDLVGPVDAHVGVPDTLDVGHQGVVTLNALTSQSRVTLLGGVAPIA